MRKPVLIGIVVFLIVVAGGTTVTWMLQASRIKTQIEQGIARLSSDDVKIAYDALETSGFPTEVVVSIVNPRLTGRLDKLFAQMPKNNRQTLPEWNEDVSLNGTLTIGVNALSDRYTLGMHGQWKNKSTIGSEVIAMESSPNAGMLCTLGMAHAGNWFGTLWNFQALSLHGEKPLDDFRLLDCQATENTIVLQDSKAEVMKNGPERMYISHSLENGQRQARFFFSVPEWEVMPEGDRVMGVYSRAIAPWYDSAPLFSAYGKQNTEIDFTYKGPAELTGDIKSTPLDIHLGKFIITNDAYNMNMTFDLTNSDAADGKHAARLAFKTESAYTDIYHALITDLVRSAIKDMYAEPSPSPELKAVTERQTPESLYALVQPAIPDLHALGRLVMALDLGYQGNREFTEGDITLSTLELSATPYGITAQGTGKRTTASPFPAVNIALTCANCLKLIDDVTEYVRRLQTVVVTLQPEKPVKPMSQATVDGYKQFLEALAGKNINGQNFTYAIVGDGLGVTVNNQRMDEVMRLYRQYVPRDREQPAQ